MDIGLKLKQLRIKMNLTQEELANRCELTKGFISQLEHNLTSPSISTLTDLLEGLGTDLKHFFDEGENNKILFKKEDVFEQENTELGHKINWLIPNAQKNSMEPILISIKKSGKSSIYSPHEGEVFGYVIQGNIDLFLGTDKFKVKKGESFYYKANSSHHLENNYMSDATILWVSNPPHF